MRESSNKTKRSNIDYPPVETKSRILNVVHRTTLRRSLWREKTQIGVGIQLLMLQKLKLFFIK